MSIDQDVRRTARALAREIAANKTGRQRIAAGKLATEHPEAVLTIADLVVDEGSREQPDDNLLAAYFYMLESSLLFLRDLLEAKDAWAEELLAALRGLLSLSAEIGQVPGPLLLLFLNSFREAGLEPGEDLVEKAGQLAFGDDDVLPPPDLEAVEAVLEDIVEQAGGDAFAVYHTIGELIESLPVHVRQTFAMHLAEASHPVLREAAALFLFDRCSDVRGITCGALRAAPAALSPDTLRRLIAIRNWLPAAERGELDAVIRAARKAGIACASWPMHNISQLLASPIDGAGAQSLFAIAKNGRKHLLAALLLKEGVGVADAWTVADQSKSEIKAFLSELDECALFGEVNSDFADLIVPHFIAVGLDQDSVPPAGLLEIAERTGMQGWLPRRCSPDDLVALLAEQVAPGQATEPAVDPILASSAEWPHKLPVVQSWSELDREVIDLLDARRTARTATKVQQVISKILEPRRTKWAERLLWMALWAKNLREPPLAWQDFFIVGREVLRGRPLAQIPLLQAIAAQTVSIAGA